MCPTTTPTTLTTIPPELLDEIAFHTALPSTSSSSSSLRRHPAFGPPHDLISLLLVCRSIHENVTSSVSLYARVFRVQFDCAALWRRFPRDWLNTHALASELKRRWKALSRVRGISREWEAHAKQHSQRHSQRHSQEDDEAPTETLSTPAPGLWSACSKDMTIQDLWTVYLMLLESDGTNEGQRELHSPDCAAFRFANILKPSFGWLVRWAGAPAYIDGYITSFLLPRSRNQPETVETTLTLWISWLFTDRSTSF